MVKVIVYLTLLPQLFFVDICFFVVVAVVVVVVFVIKIQPIISKSEKRSVCH